MFSLRFEGVQFNKGSPACVHVCGLFKNNYQRKDLTCVSRVREFKAVRGFRTAFYVVVGERVCGLGPGPEVYKSNNSLRVELSV